MTLTEKEREFAEKNHRLIYAYMSRKKLKEDAYFCLAEGYLNAVMMYSRNEKFRNYQFSTIAFWQMKNEFSNETEKANRKKRGKGVIEFSSNEKHSEDDDSFSLEEIIVSNDDVFDKVYVLVSIEEIKNKLNQRDNYIFDLLISGENQLAIAKSLGVTQQSISKRISYIRKIAGKILG